MSKSITLPAEFASFQDLHQSVLGLNFWARNVFLKYWRSLGGVGDIMTTLDEVRFSGETVEDEKLSLTWAISSAGVVLTYTAYSYENFLTTSKFIANLSKLLENTLYVRNIFSRGFEALFKKGGRSSFDSTVSKALSSIYIGLNSCTEQWTARGTLFKMACLNGCLSLTGSDFFVVPTQLSLRIKDPSLDTFSYSAYANMDGKNLALYVFFSDVVKVDGEEKLQIMAYLDYNHIDNKTVRLSEMVQQEGLIPIQNSWKTFDLGIKYITDQIEFLSTP